jgi:site-specific recombinase XerD
MPSPQAALRLVKSGRPKHQIESVTELELAMKEWAIALRQEGLAVRTIEAYQWHVDRLVKWLAGRGVTAPQDVSRVTLREWGASLHEKWQATTMKQALAAVRSFFKWCWQERLISDNPADVLKTPKTKMRVQRTVSQEEIQVLVAGCDLSTPKGIRDRALISLLYDSGLRAAELCRLQIDDVDLTQQELKVVVKGGNEERGWFGETTTDYIRAWLQIRTRFPQFDDALFVSVGGTRPYTALTVGGLRAIVRKMGIGCGVKKLSVHAFRRGFAVSLSMAGVPDNILKDLGRWEDTSMIKQYTRAQQAGRVYRHYAPMDHASVRNADR